MLAHRFRATLLITALLQLASCGERAPRDIVFITVDTLRPDHLGLYGYPRPTSPELDRWFGEAAIFERAYATEANTSPSIASMLSGLLPQEHRVRLLYQLLPDEVRLLPELLPPEYQSAAFVSNVVLTNEALGIADRFDHYDDFVDEAIAPDAPIPLYERKAGPTTDAVLRWLSTERDPARPLFLWVHYIDPHSPYDAPPDSRPRFDVASPHTYPTELPELMARLQVDEPSSLATIDRYDEEIHYTDAAIGRLLEGYASHAALEDALIVFTADHGESIFEHDAWFAHGYQVYDEIVRIPLMIRGPGFSAGRHEQAVSGIDLTTTMLTFAGVDPPAAMRGLDLATGTIPEERPIFMEATRAGHFRGAVAGSQKWVLHMKYGESEVVARRHYDLDADPLELDPTTDPPQGDAYRDLQELVRSDPDPGGLPANRRRGDKVTAPKVAPRASAEQLEKLRALGYVE